MLEQERKHDVWRNHNFGKAWRYDHWGNDKMDMQLRGRTDGELEGDPRERKQLRIREE